MSAPIVRVFVSSTWLDLGPEREAVQQAIHDLRETKFVGMEYFGSRDETTREASLDEVDGSQVYVGIFGGRYGSGITEAEYRRARERGLPCFIYFKAEATIAVDAQETDPAQSAKLTALKQELRLRHTVKEFGNPDRLAGRLTGDLHRWLVEKFLKPKLEQGARGEVPVNETQALLAAIKDLGAINQQLLDKLRDRGFVIAQGDRSVAAETISDSALATGDGNVVLQGGAGKPVAAASGGKAAGRHIVEVTASPGAVVHIHEHESPAATGTPPTAAPGRDPADAAPEKPIVPCGLSSFGREAEGFFLRLLPGNPEGGGLPPVIAEWKKRLEEPDADRTFKVGLIYGPSGCGKSSLVKAGLMPVLDDSVVKAIHVEATPNATEDTLLRELRKLPELKGVLPPNGSLGDVMAFVRDSSDLLGGRKIVFLIDQFEQWLSAPAGAGRASFVDALRLCDGGRFQVVLLAREEFYATAERLLESLGLPLDRQLNVERVDLFSREHAEKVLFEYGRAYQRLLDGKSPPRVIADRSRLSPDQKEFLEEVLDGLGEPDGAGNVVFNSVKLALVSQMLDAQCATEPKPQDRRWKQGDFKNAGGLTGLTVNFLDREFRRGTADRKATMRILASFLPEQGSSSTASGSGIRGLPRSAAELQEIAGYDRRGQAFEALMKQLGALYLLTPVESTPSSAEAANADGTRAGPVSGSPSESADPGARYQLTHDYLVIVVREWLARERPQSPREQATFLLEQRSEEWRRHERKNRYLPSPFEYARMLLRADRTGLNSNQRAFLAAARWFYAWRVGALGTGFVCIILLGVWFWDRGRAENIVREAVLDQPEKFARHLGDLGRTADHARPLLQQIVVSTNLSGKALDANQWLHAVLALAHLGDVRVPLLVDQAATGATNEWANILQALGGAKDAPAQVTNEVRMRFETAATPEQRVRLVSLALHFGDEAYATSLLELTNDPASRTAFIHAYPTWRTDLTALAEKLQKVKLSRRHDHFRSGMCAALALVPWQSLNNGERTALTSALTALYVDSPDGGTHSAALCAMTRWKQPLPTNAPSLEPTKQAPKNRDWFVNSLGMTMVKVPAGKFMRGSDSAVANDSEKPGHLVTLTNDFWMLDREVTVKSFRQFVAESKVTDWDGEDTNISRTVDCPVQQVTWDEAVAFCNWLSDRTGTKRCYAQPAPGEDTWVCDFKADGYRLPTEAEWEYACRARSEAEYAFGDDPTLLAEYAYFEENSHGQARPAGSRLANGWGLFDLHGSLYEWCWDWYARYPDAAPPNPAGPEQGTARVLRGGSWDHPASYARCAFPLRRGPDSRSGFIGFRVVASPF